MNEKRREKRFRTEQKVWCEGQDSRLPAEARDISRNGMALVTGEAAEVGSRLKVSFAVPEGGDVAVDMEVVWREERPEGQRVAMGLRVVEFKQGKEAFDRFVAKHLIESRPPSIRSKEKEKP
jgi:hypothetical protein